MIVFQYCPRYSPKHLPRASSNKTVPVVSPLTANLKNAWSLTSYSKVPYSVGGQALVIFRRIRKIFEKRQSASSCLSLCPSVRMEQLGSHWTDFHEIS